MSIMCCIYVPEGIVMAADSRLTRTKPQNAINIPHKDGENEKVLLVNSTYTLSDNAQKVLLIKKAGVGVSFCGEAMINGVTVADFIRKFEIEKVEEGDSAETVANKLIEYYKGTETHFFVCGYNADIPYVFDVNRGVVERANVAKKATDEPVKNDVADGGDTPDLGVPENLPTEEVGDAEIPFVTNGALWAGRMTAITKVVNTAPALNADWGTMPLKDAIDFAEFLIDTTIKYERFCDEIQTCGGDVDILVITKDEAFWKQHKIYNPKK